MKTSERIQQTAGSKTVDAERFITLISREPFDYTEWQRNLFEGMSVRELSKKAMQKYTEI